MKVKESEVTQRTDKMICHCHLSNITFHNHVMLKSCNVLILYIFTTKCSNLNLGATGGCYQEWNDLLGVRPMIGL